jgi:hypothetical protein
MLTDGQKGYLVGLVIGICLFAGIQIFIDVALSDFVEPEIPHWDCENKEYKGPTGDNHSVEVYRLPPYRWLDGSRYWD